ESEISVPTIGRVRDSSLNPTTNRPRVTKIAPREQLSLSPTSGRVSPRGPPSSEEREEREEVSDGRPNKTFNSEGRWILGVASD
ncbi:hypothetical protein PFISCL1PPCAC_26874, partial [Pristionchus fissidentatus]